MIKLALAIAFLAVFGLAGYGVVVLLTRQNKSDNSNPKKNVK